MGTNNGSPQKAQAETRGQAHGQIVIDDPANLPDGAKLDVFVVDDDLTADERAELHASLERALDDSEAGRGTDASNSSGGTERGVKIILLDEAQLRFEAEDA